MTKFDSLRDRKSRASLHHQVAGHLGSLIGAGQLRSGSVLPNESALGNQFGVSRTVLREAIKVLASKGLVDVRRKTGTRVRPSDEWNMFDPDVLSWSFLGNGAKEVLKDLSEIRRIVEPVAARMAAERATPEDVACIDKAYREMVDAADNLRASIRPDLMFHLGVLSATHNLFLRSFGSLIQSALKASFSFTSTNKAAYLCTLPLHKKIFDAIAAGDGGRAEKAMIGMLDQTSKDIANEFGPSHRKKPIARSGRTLVLS